MNSTRGLHRQDNLHCCNTNEFPRTEISEADNGCSLLGVGHDIRKDAFVSDQEMAPRAAQKKCLVHLEQQTIQVLLPTCYSKSSLINYSTLHGPVCSPPGLVSFCCHIFDPLFSIRPLPTQIFFRGAETWGIFNF